MNRKSIRILLAIIMVIIIQVTTITGVTALASKGDFTIQNGVLKAYTGKGGNVVIPDGVIEIDDEVFRDCTTITSITIPDSVVTIGDRAFQNCSGIKEITIPKGVRNYGYSVFSYCTGLVTAIFEDGLEIIGPTMFLGCTNLKTVYISETIKSIYTCSFSGCEKLQGFIVDPESRYFEEVDGVLYWRNLAAIYKYPQGKKQTTFNVPEGVERIINQAFSVCVNLTKIKLPESLIEIDALAFTGCKNLDEIILPQNLQTIDVWAFNECINIKSVYIPASVYDIHGGAFSACSSLESYYLDNANTTYTSIDGVLFTKDKSVLISYPGGRNGDYEIRTGTTEIGEFAFYNCEYLTSITIPDTVSAINEYAFSECNNLININIPDSITYIGEYAFSNAPLTGISDNSVSVLKRLYKGNDDRWYENIMYSKKILESNNNITGQWLNPGNYVGIDYGGTNISRISKDIEMLSDMITQGTKSDYEKVKLIYMWVAENIYYDWDAYINNSPFEFNPDDVLNSKRSVCEGYANLTEALVRAQGIPCKSVVGYALGFNTSGKWNMYNVDITDANHKWNEAYVDGRWLVMDTTWGSNNKYESGEYIKEGNASLVYFDISNTYLALSYKIISRGDTNKKDIPSEWGEKEILNGFALGLIPYDMQGDYRNEITREEFCRLVVRLIEKIKGMDINKYLKSVGISINKLAFKDTSDLDVLAANALNIVNGRGDGTFGPKDSITRQEAAVMLYRMSDALGVGKPNNSPIHFNDASSVAPWAFSSVEFVSAMLDNTTGNRVMGGAGNNKFLPIATYTKEQSYLTVVRLFNIISKTT
jgi:hypothetical protein